MSTPEITAPAGHPISLPKGPSLRIIVAFVLIVLALALSHFAKPTKHLSDTQPAMNLETVIPTNFGDWHPDERSGIITPAPDVKAALDSIYKQVLSRTYVNKQGYRIMLSIAYGGDQSDGLKAHRPERCYAGQGFEVLSSAPGELRLPTHALPIRHVTTQMSGKRFEPLTYWMMIAERPIESGLQQKLAQMRYGLTGYIPDGMLIRVSSIDKDNDRAFALQTEFIKALSQAVSPTFTPRIFGTPN